MKSGPKQNGYDAFFKKRRQLDRIKTKGFIRRLSKPSSKRKPWALILFSFALLGAGCWYLTADEEQVSRLMSHLMNRFEVSVFGEATAAESADAQSNSGEKTAPDKPSDKTQGQAQAAPGTKTWTDEEIMLFTKLEGRKKQLDAREAELTRLDEELQRTKEEIDKRLQKLEEVRTTIATKLEDRVKVDSQRVETLVNVYANMKPAQAAKVIESLDEDLAVEVLSKMKNKNAAEILNLMDAAKAKKISERFAGFKEPAMAGN